MAYQLCLIWLSIGSLFYAQVKTSQQDVLSRVASVKPYTGASSGAIADLLAGTHVPGGIVSVYSRCSTPAQYQFPFDGATLGKELDYVRSIDSSRVWIYRDGFIIVNHDLINRTVLAANISDIDVNPDDALTLSTQKLVRSPEVAKRVKDLRLEEMYNRGGFSAIRASGYPNEEVPASPPQHLHQINLEDALNRLASIKGNAVWHYEQFECGTKSTFRIQWIVK
jgi:hypothetical protein